MLRTASLRVLGPADLPAVPEILARDPVANVFVASRVAHGRPRAAGASAARCGATWSTAASTPLCYAGANLVPVQAGPDAQRAFAERARRQGRRCSSIVGPRRGGRADVGAARAGLGTGPRRAPQPAADGDRRRRRRCRQDPGVRRVRPDELDILLPACVAMFTEEVGVSPTVGDGGATYRARVAELIAAGRAFARIEDGRGGLQGRDRVGDRPAPARCRACGCHPSCAAGACPPAGWPPWSNEALRDDRPGRQPLRQRLQRGRPGRPTAGWGSRTPARSCRSCSDLRRVSGMWAWRSAGSDEACILYSVSRTNRQCRESAPCRTSAGRAAASPPLC